MVRVLVTGGAGFIGKHLCNRLLESSPDIKVCVLDNLHRQVHGDLAVAPESSPRFIFRLGSIGDRELVKSILSDFQPDIIYHLAAETGTGQSLDEMVRYNEVNVVGTAILLEELNKNSRRCRKLILTSSRAVYGEGPWLTESGKVVTGKSRDIKSIKKGVFVPTFPGEILVKPIASNERSELSPVSIYASTKLMQEYICSQGQGDWETVIFRLQNVYGAGQSLRNPYTGVLSIFCNQAFQNETINVFEDGKIQRDFIYVDDVVSALIQPTLIDSADGQILNIGTGKAVTICQVAQEIMSRVGNNSEDFRISGDFRRGDIRHACADISKAQTILGWKPTISIEEGLQRLVDWARQTSNRLDPQKM